MRIEHVAIWTKDLEKMKDYYVEFFNGVPGDKYHNHNTGLSSYFLTFDSGARLEIMSKPDVKDMMDGENINTGYAHMAFSVGSEERVRQLTEEIRERGYKVLSEPRTTGDGYFESCVSDPEGNRVEITI